MWVGWVREIMPLRLDLQIRDYSLARNLGQAREVWIPESMEENIEETVAEIVTLAREYPPTSEANHPPPPYYQRGVGYFGRTGKLTKPSEQLNTRWEKGVRRFTNRVEGVVINRASYSGYVQDRQFQTPFHQLRGWRTVQDIVDDIADGDEILTKVRRTVDRIIARLRSVKT